jgi:beta-carotene/zeaxanthin 4-ketolase
MLNLIFYRLFFYLHILIQAYLYTGLFITGHDAMHGTVAKNRKAEQFFRTPGHHPFCISVFPRTVEKTLPAPPFSGHRTRSRFFAPQQQLFYLVVYFYENYTTWWQILFMAIMFNVLLIWFSEVQLIAFWVVPAILATFQLFFFGTYLPHRRPVSEQMKPHNSRTQIPKTICWPCFHVIFFGYHWEHHESPTTPGGNSIK